METLNQYEARITLQLMKLPLNKWYNIKPDREDYEAFMMTIYSRIFAFGDFEFRNNRTEFRRVNSVQESDIPKDGRIRIKIDFHEQTEEFNWDHLPKTEPPKMDHKAWEKRKGRAV